MKKRIVRQVGYL